MTGPQVMLITGSRTGIGRALAQHYVAQGWRVVGCSRSPADYELEGYQHFCLDVANEEAVKGLFVQIQADHSRLDVLVNNAGIASMNHCLLTPMSTVEQVLRTNVTGTYLFCREAARLMQRVRAGRIVNLSTVAVPLKLEGEAIYAASKSAVETLTMILARELGSLGITVNAVGPGPLETGLTRNIPNEKLKRLVGRQAIRRPSRFCDVINVVDFFIRPESELITGQIVYLGGV